MARKEWSGFGGTDWLADWLASQLKAGAGGECGHRTRLFFFDYPFNPPIPLTFYFNSFGL